MQSFPIPGTDFKYSFHADMEFDNAAQLKNVIKKLENLTDELNVLGVYKNGKIK